MDRNDSLNEQIRTVVREALREILPKDSSKQSTPTVAPNCLLMKKIFGALKSEGESLVELNIQNDEQLNNFVLDFAKCLHDRDVQALLFSGRLRFKLRSSIREKNETPITRNIPKDAPNQKTKRSESRFESGMLSEAQVTKLANTSQRIVVSKKVVVTPLAKDRARAIGIEIVRR